MYKRQAHYLKEKGVDVLTFPDSPSGRTRADSILIAAKVSRQTGMCVMPHLCCRDKNAIAIRSQLLGAHINGINNFLVITGDPIPQMIRSSVKSVFNFDSVGLMNIIEDMNEDQFKQEPIVYGGAINQGRKRLDIEISRVKKKMEAGAAFFMTQPVFSDEDIKRLSTIKKETGARILCGIMPLVSLKNATFMKNEMAGIDVTDEVLSRYMTGERIVTGNVQSRTKDHTQNYIKEFNLNYWNPRPIKKDNPYLTVQRKLSPQTVEDFANRLFIYQVGKNNHIGFPFRKPSQMEILNFEMRNYFAETNTNYKAFATGGDKAQSCWMANFVPFDKVTDIYLFESAIDAMSFYEINHYTKETTCAFISTGGYVTKSQIENISRIFPSDKVKWNCCYDNDASGNGFDITTAYYLKGEECKAFARTNTGDTYKTIYLSFPDGNTQTFKEDAFSSGEYLKQHGIDNVNIIKPSRYKDWNELLVYYKRFDLNLGPGMKFIPAIEKTISQLNLRGYEQLANSISSSTKELVDSLLEQANYCISAPLAESGAYTLMVDCNIFMGLDTMVPVPSNLYVIEKCTQKKISAHAINEFLKKEYINIFRDMSSSDFKNFLEKDILTYTKGAVEKNFEKVILTFGWSLKPSILKKKSFDLEHGI